MNDSTGGRMPAAHQDDTFDLDLPGGERLLAARTVTPPSADVLARVQAVVDAAVERELPAAAPEDVATVTAPARHRLLRRRWIVSAALVAAAATCIAVLPAVSFGGGKPAASANAATFLNELADRMEAGPPVTAVGRMKGAPYWKTVSLQSGGNPKPVTTTVYISAKDGSERQYMGDSHQYLKITNDQRTMHWYLGRTAVDLTGLDRLPTDTTRLRTALTVRNGNNALMFDEVAQLLQSPAPPKLRAALFRVLAQLPGVHLDGTRKDITGRSGTQISMTMSGAVWHGFGESLLVQPRTGTLLQHDVYMPTNTLVPHTADTFLWAGPVWKLPPDRPGK
ncbi:hypothetical protein AB0M29_14525 [Streptomyces sp. NPDC051976]|uniref:hypothetical protein n=1 Tax=Streptomyces sp. NPDC051976 TaxID=3154947 RepID=UPI0034494CBD